MGTFTENKILKFSCETTLERFINLLCNQLFWQSRGFIVSSMLLGWIWLSQQPTVIKRLPQSFQDCWQHYKETG